MKVVRNFDGSLVIQYVKRLLHTTGNCIATVTEMNIKHENDIKCDMKNTMINIRKLQKQEREGVLRHVCFLSRQTRTSKGEPERLRLSNVQTGVFSPRI